MVVEARFADVPDVAEKLCYSLSVALVPAVEASRGEQLEQQIDWRELK